MECISVFDMLKIGVGPSSSHTLGPWRAAERWIKELKAEAIFDKVERIKVDLYGSLSLTGKGHATDYALMLGLIGLDPETFPVETIEKTIASIRSHKILSFNGEKNISFSIENDIVFNRTFLPFHANGLTFTAFTKDAEYNNFLSELEQLKKIQIRNNFPDISQSLKMLRNIVKLRLESDKALQPDVESKPLTPVETQKAQ